MGALKYYPALGAGRNLLVSPGGNFLTEDQYCCCKCDRLLEVNAMTLTLTNFNPNSGCLASTPPGAYHYVEVTSCLLDGAYVLAGDFLTPGYAFWSFPSAAFGDSYEIGETNDYIGDSTCTDGTPPPPPEANKLWLYQMQVSCIDGVLTLFIFVESDYPFGPGQTFTGTADVPFEELANVTLSMSAGGATELFTVGNATLAWTPP